MLPIQVVNTSNQKYIVTGKLEKYYIHEATVRKGDDTIEWGGRMTLWGVVPLWRATRPLNTILSLKKLTPGDCWPFKYVYNFRYSNS